MSYINSGCSRKEFKDELKKRNKQHDYITGPSCVLALPSDPIGSHCHVIGPNWLHIYIAVDIFLVFELPHPLAAILDLIMLK